MALLNLPDDCRYHTGADPVYKSFELEQMIPWILALTRTDQDGSRYYRVSQAEGWRRLKTAEDYARLNRALDAYRTNNNLGL